MWALGLGRAQGLGVHDVDVHGAGRELLRPVELRRSWLAGWLGYVQ
jgi:hypothetical protein